MFSCVHLIAAFRRLYLVSVAGHNELAYKIMISVCLRKCVSSHVFSLMLSLGVNEHGKAKKRGGRRHRSNMMKRPMALAAIIMELLDVEKRENALRCLSGHLIEVGQILPEFKKFLKDVVSMDVSWMSPGYLVLLVLVLRATSDNTCATSTHL